MAPSSSTKQGDDDTLMPLHLWSHAGMPSPRLQDVLTQLAHFFDQLGYTRTFTALMKESAKHGLTLDIDEWQQGLESGIGMELMDLYASFQNHEGSFPSLRPSSDEDEDSDSSDDDESSEEVDSGERDTDEKMIDDEAEETSDDSSDESVSGDVNTRVHDGPKRKRVLTPESSAESSDDEDSSESEGGDHGPPSKRAKTADSDESSASDSSDSEPESAEQADQESKLDGPSSTTSSSESDSSSADDSASSGSESESSSDSSSDTSSESDSGSPSPSPSPKKKAKQVVKKKQATTGSATSSSATLGAQSPPPQLNGTKTAKGTKKINPVSTTIDTLVIPVPEEPISGGESGMHPDRMARLPAKQGSGNKPKGALVPATKENVAKLKKENVPFSRIPADQRVDPRFATNEYVSYDYADRAYQDLVVTKGKGFTKEKNKKKRGSYRGGAIDLTPKGIKFED